jgi:hypothetical protein
MKRMLLVLLVLHLVLPAWAWGPYVHRSLTYLALDGLPADIPAWLRDPNVRDRIAFQSNQPDNWREWKSVVLEHVNNPDHYLDVERLEDFGLTLQTVPKLRREYLKAMVLAKYEHPERVSPYDPATDPARVQEWPGFVLQAVAEEYAKLQSAFSDLRKLEQGGDSVPPARLEQARAVVIEHMGNLSHFVEDMAQPLHTTKHYDGWVGENPAGYRWRKDFHAYIDTGLPAALGLTYEALKPQVSYGRRVNASDPWEDVIQHFQRSHDQLVRLYELERDGQLDGPEGRALIAGRLADAAAMTSAMIWAAYTSSGP